MSATKRQPAVKMIDDQAEGAPSMSGDANLTDFIDEPSLTAEISKAAARNRAESRPFRQYQKKVIEKAGVPNTHQTRQIASHVCGAVARLPFVPDSDETIQDDRGNDTTEYDQQVIKTAAFAEHMLESEAVWTVSARKLARAALALRREDPDGSQGIAWVNDALENEAGVLDA